MHDLFVADTSDFGIVRIFCDTPRRGRVLEEAGYRARVVEVLAVAFPTSQAVWLLFSRPSTSAVPTSNTATVFLGEKKRPLTF